MNEGIKALRKIKPNSIYVTIICVSLVLYEIISYSSSYETVYGFTGMKSWAKLLAWAFIAVDFGGVASMMMGEKVEEAGGMHLFWAWLISAAGDAYMTYIPIAASASTRTDHILITSGVISVKAFTVVIPILIAVLIWGIQVVLVVSLNKIFDSMMRSSRS